MNYIPLIARTCLSLVFLSAGINHLEQFEGFVANIANKGLPFASVLAIFTIVFQIIGAISLIIGFKAKLGAMLLIIFLIPATIFFVPPSEDINSFFKNVALLGGLLMVVAYGPGIISVDGSNA